MSPPLRITLAVVTYQRPAELGALLPALLAQARTCPQPAAVLVVDNDPAASAAVVVAEHAGVRLVTEPEPGIAAARNRALAEASDSDLLVFIDDDEWPAEGWLAALLAGYESCGHPTAVLGAVHSQFSVPVSPWLEAGRFFDRHRPEPPGATIEIAATNNLLLDLHQVADLGLSFDPALGLSGGSDTLFTRQLSRRGGRMVWWPDAVVVEPVPADRLTRKWVLRRAMRMGNSWSRTALMLPSSRGRFWLTRLQLTGLGLSRLGGGGAQWLAGLLRRRVADRAQGARTLARGAGMTAGAWGYALVEYRRVARR